MIDEKQQKSDLSPEVVKSLNRWVKCITIVSFDADEGQKVTAMIPSIQFAPKTSKQLAMLSFPDSNSFCDTENIIKYTFKLSNGLYGFTCFKQKKDKTNTRGYSQKSLVILSELPFVYFYEKMVEFIVFKCLHQQEELVYKLMEICNQIAKWPDPTPKANYILPILSYELEIAIPNYIQSTTKQSYSCTNKIGEPQLEVDLKQTNKDYSLYEILSQERLKRCGLFQEIHLYDIFSSSPEALWTLWESVLLNKSVLIMGSNPQQVSHAVLGTISLISPFVYIGNVNPYTTVYDPNLDLFQTQSSNWIFGGTNPLFLKLFKKQITQIVSLEASYKAPKHLKPLKEMLIKCKTEEERMVNELGIRKYFYKLSRGLMNILDFELNMQANSLKMFNEKQFMRKLKDRKEFYGLENVFSSKKMLLGFFQKFVGCANFEAYLRERNAIRTKK